MNANSHSLRPADRRRRLRPLTLRFVGGLCVFAMAVICQRSLADEFAFVSDDSLRLVDSSGQLVAELPRYAVLDVKTRNSGKLIVSYDEQDFEITTAQVYLSSQFPSVNPDNEADMRHVVESLGLAVQAEADENDRLADTTAELALKRLDIYTEQTTLFHALIKNFQAGTRYHQEKFDEALQLLAQSDSLIANMNQQDHFIAADTLYLKALVLDQQERYEESATLYERAALILLNSLGSQHMDTALALSGLAYARSSAGQPAEALLAQQMTVNAMRKLLPPDDERIAFETAWLGSTAREAERYDVALEALRTAADLYERQHPELQSELYDVYTDVIYINTETGDFESADRICETALALVRQMPAELQTASLKDLLLRQGRIDFDQADYPAALIHFRDAIAKSQPDSPDETDGNAHEWVGDVFVEQDRLNDAKQAYERSIERLAASGDPESDRILDLREYADNLESDTDNTLGDVVMVELPRGYLLNDDGSVAHMVPGMTILDWRQSDSEFHTVVYNGELYRLANSQLRTFRELPGYAFATPGLFRTLMQSVTDSLIALNQQQPAESIAHLRSAIELSRREYGENTSLTLWLEVMEAAIQSRIKGPRYTLAALDEMQPRLDAVNVNAYDFAIDIGRIRGSCYLDLDDGEKAVQHYRAARDAAAELFGPGHAVTINNTRHLAKALRYNEQFEQALEEFESAYVRTARQYPGESFELAETASEMSVVLLDLGRTTKAKKLLEEALLDGAELPPEPYLSIAGSLARIYLGEGDDVAAREIAEAVVEELSPDDLDAVPGLMSLQVLSKLDVKEERWDDAIEHLTATIDSMAANGLSDNFAATQIHELLATAYEKTDRSTEAVGQLERVLEIYLVLGGDQSPEADAVRERISQLNVPRSQTPVTSRELIQFFNLTPRGESMQIVLAACDVKSAPESGSRTISQLQADEEVWSLKQQDGFHRIYVRAKQAYGWVAQEQLTSKREHVIRTRTEELRRQLSHKAPEEVDGLLQRFEQAREFSGPDLKKIDALIDSYEEIDAASDGRSLLAGVLWEEVLSIRSRRSNYSMYSEFHELVRGNILRTYGYHHPGTAAARYGSARVAFNLNQPVEAISQVSSVLKTCQRHFGPRDRRTLAYMLSLAEFQMIAGDFSASRASHMTALEGLERLDRGEDSDNFLRGLTLLSLANLDLSQRSYDAATKHLHASLKQFEHIEHVEGVPMADVYNKLVWCHLKQDNIAAAKEASARAQPYLNFAQTLQPAARMQLEIAAASPDDLTETITSLTELVDSREAQQTDLSVLQQKLALAKSRSHRDEAIREVGETLRDEHKFLNDVVRLLEPQLQVSRTAITQDRLMEATSLSLQFPQDHVHAATAEWVINLHNRLPELASVARRAHAAMDSLEECNAFARWEQVARKLAQLPSAFKIGLPPDTVAATISTLREDEAERFQKLPQRVQSIYNDKPKWIGLKELRSAMEPDESLVILRRSLTPGRLLSSRYPANPAETYVAWIIPATAEAPVRVVNLGPTQELEQTVQQTLQAIHKLAGRITHGGSQAEAIGQERQLLKRLSEQLWAPVESELQSDTRRLTLCADSSLHAVPWDGLPDRNETLLSERFTIRYLSTPRDLVRTPPTANGGSPMVISQPDYQRQDPAFAELPRVERMRLSRKASGQAIGISRNDLVRALENTANSDEDFLSLLNPDTQSSVPNDRRLCDEIERLTGERLSHFQLAEASEYRLLTSRPGAVLQISAAGFENQPRRTERRMDFCEPALRRLVASSQIHEYHPLTCCGLLMSGSQAESAHAHLDDGIWTGADIAAMNLDGTKLVVLAQAPEQSDGQPAVSVGLIPQLFQIAGARAVVSQTLPVDAELSQSLLQRVYHHLASGVDVAVAVQRAQKEIRQQLISESGYAPVSQWAGLRVTGASTASQFRPVRTAETEVDDNMPQRDHDGQVDVSDPKSVARLVLQRYAEKDVGGLLALSQEGPVAEYVLQKYAPGSSRYQSLFSESAWRWQAVKNWNGQLPQVSYTLQRRPSTKANADYARVEFGRSEAEVYVVTLERKGEKWLFEDIHSPDAADFPRP